MNIAAIIPARFNSSRFPGKPLADIKGNPMIYWVYERASRIKGIEMVVVATDHHKIYEKCVELGMNVIMTSDFHRNGTERICEVSQEIEADYYITLQGDEPLFEIENVEFLIEQSINKPEIECATLMTRFKNPVDVINSTTPKVVTNNNSEIIYISRSPIPYPKNELSYSFYKPLGQYFFTKGALNNYQKLDMGPLEKAEDIELLRFIENNYSVKIFEVESASIAVDTPKDLERVRLIMEV